MYMKVFPHGKGAGSGPVNYLLRMDYAGREEAPPAVLRGDPETTKQLIDSQERVWKFTAGVLSWAPGEDIPPEMENELMDSFESVAFAGLEPDQYDVLWVRHTHAAHHELHFVIPRTELHRGKAYNPCPPGWQKDFDVFRDLHNWREGWARPDDPERARAYKPSHTDLTQARRIRWGLQTTDKTKDDPRRLIHEFITQRIEAGTVANREEMVQALHEAGLETPRLGKNYLTVLDPESGTRIRMKGDIYSEHWRLEQQTQRQDQPGPGAVRDNRAQRVRELSEELERVIAKRAAYNRKRYQRPTRQHEHDAHQFAAATAVKEQHIPQSIRQNPGQVHNAGAVSGARQRTGGLAADHDHNTLYTGTPERNHKTAEATNNCATDPRRTGTKDMGSSTAGHQRGAFHHPAKNHNSKDGLDSRHKKSPEAGTGVIHEQERTGAPSTGGGGEGAAGNQRATGDTRQTPTRDTNRFTDTGADHKGIADNASKPGHRHPKAQRVLRQLGTLVAAAERYFAERGVSLFRHRTKTGKGMGGGFEV